MFYIDSYRKEQYNIFVSEDSVLRLFDIVWQKSPLRSLLSVRGLFILHKNGERGMHALAFLAIFVGALFQNWTMHPDIWFLLNNGRYVAEYGIPDIEPLTMHDGLHYVMEQWMTCVAFWKIYDKFGEDGLLGFTFLIALFLLYAYYRLCRVVSGKTVSIAFTILFGLIACPFFVTTRPQILSCFFFILEVLLLEIFARTNNWRRLLPIPLISVVLININAALWPMLLILFLPFIVASFLNKKIGFESFPLKPIILCTISSFVCGFLNPYGFDAMSFAFRSYDSNVHDFIVELKPMTITTSYGMIFFILLFLLIFIGVRNKMPLQYILLSAGTALMSLFAARNMFIFLCLGTFPIAYVCKNIEPLNRKGLSPGILFLFSLVGCAVVIWKIDEMQHLPVLPCVYLTFAWISFCCYFFFYSENGKRFDMERLLLRLKFSSFLFVVLISMAFMFFYNETHHSAEKMKPLIDYLYETENPQHVRLWTGYDTGGYVGFRGLKYYIDNRPEVFLPVNTKGENIVGDYLSLIKGELEYKKYFAEHDFTYVITCVNDLWLHSVLPYDNNFQLLYEIEHDPMEYRLYKVVRK